MLPVRDLFYTHVYPDFFTRTLKCFVYKEALVLGILEKLVSSTVLLLRGLPLSSFCTYFCLLQILEVD